MSIGLTITHKAILLVSIPLLVLLSLALSVGWMHRVSEQAVAQTERSREASEEAQRLFRSLVDCESSVRGFVITHNPAFLETYDRALPEIPAALGKLRQLLDDSPAQQAMTGTLAEKASAKLDILAKVAGTARGGDFDQAVFLVTSEIGKQAMDEFRVEFNQFTRRQDDLVARRKSELERSWGRLRILHLGGTALTVIVTFLMAWIFERGTRRRIAVLNENVGRLSEGKRLAAPIGGHDEFARLEQAFYTMADSLEAAARKERAIFDHTLDVICSVDSEGKFVKVSPACREIWGFEPDELTGKPVGEILSSGVADRLAQTLAACRSGVAAREVAITCRRKDGSAAEVLWSAIWSAEERMTFCVVHDLTATKRAESDLQLQTAYFEQLYQSSPEGIVLLDNEDVITSANEAFTRLFGYTQPEVIGRRTTELIVPDELQSQAASLTAQVAEGHSINIETVRRRKDGSRLRVSILGTPIRSSAGQIAVYGIYRDITQERLAEEALIESEARYRELVQTARDVIFTVATDTTIVSLNAAFESLTGWSREQWVGESFSNLLDPEDLPAVMAIVDRARAREDVPLFETRVRTCDGPSRVVEITLSPQQANGRVVNFLGIARDITDRKQAEEALRESEDRFRTALNHAPIGMAIVALDGTFLIVNCAFSEIVGYTEAELQGMTFQEITHPDDLEEDLRLAARLRRGEIDGYRMEKRYLHRRGHPVWIHLSVSMVRDPAGQPLYYIAQIENIHERKRTEEELIRLAYVTESIGEFVVVADLDGQINYVNKAVLDRFGYLPSELIGKPARHFLSPRNPEDLADRIRAGTHAGGWRGEVINITRNGEEFWAYLTTSLFTHDGVVKGSVSISRDISESKEFERELSSTRDAALRSAQLKSEFLANMSHEIRTPMNGIIGMTGLLLDTALTPAQQEFAETIRVSANALLQIINDLLDFSRIEAGKLRMETIEFNLRTVIDDVVSLLSEKAHAKGLELAALVYRDVPVDLRGDPGRLRQVLINLIGNAVKFTERGEILVRVVKERETESSLVIRCLVTDTGIGVAPEAQARLFQPFSQADGSTTRKYGGTGLGLAISKQIVELMGGEIGVQSSPGSGSTFWFTVQFLKQIRHPGASAEEGKEGVAAGGLSAAPLSAASTPVDAMPFQAESGAEGNGDHRPEIRGSRGAPVHDPDDNRWGGVTETTSTYRLLLIEEEGVNRRVTLHMLQSLGWAPDIAGSAGEAVQALNSGAYDLVLLDTNLPDLDASEAARRMQNPQDPSRSANLVMMTTGEADPEPPLPSGAKAFLRKPVEKAALTELLSQITRSAEPQKAELAAGIISVDETVIEGLVRDFGPELTDELIDLFLQETPGRIASLLDSDEWTPGDSARVAHALESSCHDLGIMRMAALCKEIQAAQVEEKPETFRTAARALEQEYERVKGRLAKKRSPPAEPATS